MTSLPRYGPNADEQPISRLTFRPSASAFTSEWSERILASIRAGSEAAAPLKRMRPRLFGLSRTHASDQLSGFGRKRAVLSALMYGTISGNMSRSGDGRLESLFQKATASASELC